MLYSRSDCIAKYGSDYQINKKVVAGELYKVEKGIFSETENVPELAVLAFKYPHAVLTMHSAFYMYDLTDVIPDEYDLATDRDATKIPEKNVKQYFLPHDFLMEGVENINYKGYPIQIYSKERMLIELLRYKSKLPFDYYKEVLLNYRRILPTLDIQKIQDYAWNSPKSNKVMELLQMEVL